jgi:hypothetical protein
MCDTYKVMTGRGKEVETLSADRVNSWNGKIFAVTVCADGTPALFVPRNMLRLDEDDEDDPVVCAELVLLVPNNAQVGVSTAKAVYHEDEVDAMEAWMKTDLRSDYILMAHDYSLHAKWAEMWMSIAERAYWPSMATDIKRHVQEETSFYVEHFSKSSGGLDSDDQSSTDDCGDPDYPEWDGVPGGLAFENCTMELDRVDLDRDLAWHRTDNADDLCKVTVWSHGAPLPAIREVAARREVTTSITGLRRDILLH